MRLASLIAAVISVSVGIAAPPTDNPVATFYSDDAGYPARTDRVRWNNVIDMSQYDRGRTNFQRFENARDQLVQQGGGVLYYPGGVCDFAQGPFDGPNGRGLMLRSGVVLRGEAPPGHAAATSGRLDLPTKFVFGFKRRDNAVDAGERFTLELDGFRFAWWLFPLHLLLGDLYNCRGVAALIDNAGCKKVGGGPHATAIGNRIL